MNKRIWLDKLNWMLLPFSLMIAAGAWANRGAMRRAPKVVVRQLKGYSAEQRAALPFISIIVPARNEQRNLPRLLPSLLKLDYPTDKYEIIVVNDNSDDRTGAILAEFQSQDARLQVVNGTPLAAGWMGKPHALVQGAAIASGAWLLFTDADTVYQPHALLSAVYNAEQHHADLLSVSGRIELGSFWERVLMPIAFLGIFILYSPSKVNDPHSRIAIANGQFIFIKRKVYDALGGFARVRGQIAEDLEFGKLTKSSGYRLWLADGRDLMAVRMYTNFAETWEGWSKNTALAARDQPAMLVLGIAAMLGAGVVSPLLPLMLGGRLLGRLRKGKARPADALALLQSGGQLALGLGYLRVVQRNIGLPARYLLTFPLGALIFISIIFNSLYRIISGKGVTWKGRTYRPKIIEK